jgi:hypothetical protein
VIGICIAVARALVIDSATFRCSAGYKGLKARFVDLIERYMAASVAASIFGLARGPSVSFENAPIIMDSLTPGSVGVYDIHVGMRCGSYPPPGRPAANPACSRSPCGARNLASKRPRCAAGRRTLPLYVEERLIMSSQVTPEVFLAARNQSPRAN